MTDPVTDHLRWRLVVPVKEAYRAKSRLVAPAPLSRPGLARAMALDTLEAVCRALPSADVVIVTSDELVRVAAAELGVVVVPDPGAGLNAALRAGVQVAARANAGPQTSTMKDTASGAVAVGILLGDLPALRSEDLRAALWECAKHERSVVPDAEGTGTVLLTGCPGILPSPRFGSGSAALHAEVSTVLTLDLPRLRQDVDDLDALAAAISLGVGRHTTRVLSTLEGAMLPRN